MIFEESRLKGAYIIEMERIEDERGFFARSFCVGEFEKYGLNPNIIQCNVSYNKTKGIIRGMHYQSAPHEEVKLVRCTKGRIYDVIIDLRIDSSTFKEWLAIELSADNYKMLYIPKGFAHGFQTLTDNAEVFYQMSESYHPESVRNIRWNDPLFGIKWSLGEPLLSEKDRSYPLFEANDL